MRRPRRPTSCGSDAPAECAARSQPDNLTSPASACRTTSVPCRRSTVRRITPEQAVGWKTNASGHGATGARRPAGSRAANALRTSDISTISRRSRSPTSGPTPAPAGFTDDKIYVVQTNTKVIERCMLMSTDPGDLVLDPTCGRHDGVRGRAVGAALDHDRHLPGGAGAGAAAADGREVPLLPARGLRPRAARRRPSCSGDAAAVGSTSDRATSGTASSTSGCSTSP